MGRVWSRLAGASTAGHLIECGAQATGGLWHRWDEVADPAGIGYPIAVIEADGSCSITKPAGTGGLVNVATVSRAIALRDRRPGLLSDARCRRRFHRSRKCKQVWARTCVSVSERAGPAASGQLKLVAVYRDGWTASGMLAVVGRNAEAKARAAGELVLERVRRSGVSLADSLVECLGAGDVAPGVLRPAAPPFEVVLRVTVRDPERPAVERFCRELAPLVTAGPPGIAGYASGQAIASAGVRILAGPGAQSSWPKPRPKSKSDGGSEWAEVIA